MSQTTPTADDELPLQTEHLSVQWRRSALIGIITFTVGFVSAAHRVNLVPLVIAVGSYVLALSLFLVMQSAAQRKRGGQSILFTGTALCIPRRGSVNRRNTIPYARIRAVNLAGRGWYTTLAIDAGWRIVAIPIKRIGGPPEILRFFDLLKPRIMALPDGAARWASIEALRTRADTLRAQKPWATRLLGLLIVAVFALQVAWQYLPGSAGNDLIAIDFGGNASALVAQGQWWRLITASLLHASTQHLLNNLIFLLVFGALLERLVGAQRTLVVVLLTGITSQAFSALMAPHLGNYIYSVGISGALYGLIGALGALTWRLWRYMPAGFRLPGISWAVLLLLNTGLSLAVAQVDKSAHFGGLLTGAIVGWLLMRGETISGQPATLDELRRPGPVLPFALAGLAAVWLTAILAQLLHATAPDAQLADRAALMQDEFNHPHGPLVRNELAYAIALQPHATETQLRDAQALAQSAVAAAERNLKLQADATAFADTLAVLDDRLGEHDSALRLEASLARTNNPAFAMHMVAMLERHLARGGSPIIGATIALPRLRLQDGTLRFTAPEPVPQGGSVFALLRRNGTVRGVVQMYVPPGFSGEEILPLPVRYGPPLPAAPDAMWLDGASTLDVALFDTTGCHCQWPSMAPWWHPLPQAALAQVELTQAAAP